VLDGYRGPDIPHLETVAEWLETNRPASFTPGILHGDFHLGNVMYRHDGAGLAAVVDWELATVGDPLLDVGLVMAFWPGPDGDFGPATVQPWDGFPTIDEMIDRYFERSPVMSPPSIGMASSPVTRPASSSRAPTPGPTPAVRHGR
jgi:aminoglycoside phosphotransferase (APT) family kinase protein